MANPPPAPAQKKSGLGCFGCGCIILILLAILALGLFGGGSYMGYRMIYALTSPTAAAIPTFDGGDDVANGAEQKVTAFNQALDQNQPASLQLSADEINTLLGRSPDVARLNIHLFVSLTADQADVQASLPLDQVPSGLLKSRFVNVAATLSFSLDPDTRLIHLVLHNLKFGGQTIPDRNLPLLQEEFEPVLNSQLQANPALKKIIDRAKSIEIKDGEFTVETE